jgi:hypothetical protein
MGKGSHECDRDHGFPGRYMYNENEHGKTATLRIIWHNFLRAIGIWVATPYLPITHTKDNWYVVSGVNVRSKFVNKPMRSEPVGLGGQLNKLAHPG